MFNFFLSFVEQFPSDTSADLPKQEPEEAYDRYKDS